MSAAVVQRPLVASKMSTALLTTPTLVSPPANMANPCKGSDVAARDALAELSAAVVQRPRVASKMSTTLCQAPAQAQCISGHLQRLKAPLLPPKTRPPTPKSTQLAI